MAKGLSLTEIWDLSVTVSRASEHPSPHFSRGDIASQSCPTAMVSAPSDGQQCPGECLFQGCAVFFRGTVRAKANRNSWCNTCILHGSGGQKLPLGS